MRRVLLFGFLASGCLSTPPRPGANSDASTPQSSPIVQNKTNNCAASESMCTVTMDHATSSGNLLLIAVTFDPITTNVSSISGDTGVAMFKSLQNDVPSWGPFDKLHKSELWSAQGDGSRDITVSLAGPSMNRIFSIYVTEITATSIDDNRESHGNRTGLLNADSPVGEVQVLGSPSIVFSHVEAQGISLVEGMGFTAINKEYGNVEQWKWVQETGPQTVTANFLTNSEYMAFNVSLH